MHVHRGHGSGASLLLRLYVRGASDRRLRERCACLVRFTACACACACVCVRPIFVCPTSLLLLSPPARAALASPSCAPPRPQPKHPAKGVTAGPLLTWADGVTREYDLETMCGMQMSLEEIEDFALTVLDVKVEPTDAGMCSA